MATRYTRKVFPKQEAVPEGSTRLYTALLKDATGTPIPANAVSQLTLHIVDVKTGTVIRNLLNVLNQNNGTLDANGNFTYKLNGDDVKVFGTSTHERRLATFAITYSGGQENHEVEYYVENLQYIAT